MSPEAIITVSAAVVALTQLLKWAFIPDKWGPVAVLMLALVGVVLWVYSQAAPFDRTQMFSYFAAWVSVATAAAGIFGFTRAAASAVTAASPPPRDAAGSNRTVSE